MQPPEPQPQPEPSPQRSTVRGGGGEGEVCGVNLGAGWAAPLPGVSEGGSGDTPRSPHPAGLWVSPPLPGWERDAACPGDADGLSLGAGGVLPCVGPGVVTGGGSC